MASKWIDNGEMSRASAVKLGREWTALGRAVRIEPQRQGTVRVYLKVSYDKRPGVRQGQPL